MIFYNKDLFKKAGLDTSKPPLTTYAEFLATSKKIVDSRAAPSAIAPAPSSEFFQSWFDFYPLYAAESGGKQTIEDGKATFDDPAGKDVWNFWARDVRQGLLPEGEVRRGLVRRQEGRHGRRRPLGDRGLQGQGQLGRGPGPDQGRHAAPGDVYTFTDAKNIGLYSACKNQQTAWDVLKFATSKDQDGKLLETTGQMPIRTDLATTYASYFAEAPRVQDVRRPGVADRRGAQRAELRGDLAGDP